VTSEPALEAGSEQADSASTATEDNVKAVFFMS
jgi:hypothetical protein